MPEVRVIQDHSEFIAGEFHRFEQTLATMTASLPLFGPRKFAKAIRVIIKCIHESYTVELNKLKLLEPGTVKEEAEEKVKKYISILRTIHEKLLPYLESVDTTFIPSELQTALVEILKKDKKELVLFFYPTWEQNYGFHGFLDLAEQYLSDLSVYPPKDIKAELEEIPRWFAFIAYPRMESRNALLHTLMIHEAAHLVEHEKAISANLMEKVELDSSSQDKVAADFLSGKIKIGKTEQVVKSEQQTPAQLKLKDFFPEDKVRSMIKTESLRILENWLGELACDLIATRIAGPAYLFALKEFVRLTGITDSTDTHPSPYMRLKLVWEELTGTDMDYLHSELKETLEAQRYSIEKDDTKPTSPFHMIVHRSIQKGLELLKEKVRTDVIPDELAYKAEKFHNEVPYVLEHLQKGEAISDIWGKEGQPRNNRVTFVSLLNAGWLVRISRMDQFYKGLGAETLEDKVIALDNLNELLLKAIEGSSVLLKWREVTERKKEVTS